MHYLLLLIQWQKKHWQKIKKGTALAALASLFILNTNKAEDSPITPLPENYLYTAPTLDSRLYKTNLFPIQPKVNGIEIHHFIDYDKNGIYDIPRETRKSYTNSSSKYGVYVKENIPSFGFIGIIVPQHHYWNSEIDIVFSDITEGKSRNPINKKEKMDLTNINESNSYEGKPHGIITINLDKLKEAYLRTYGKKIEGKRDYSANIYRKDGKYSHWCFFRVDYSFNK
ncbi:MAG: hypothetical protein AABW65_01020 [Nanoarchaeota archaeon]